MSPPRPRAGAAPLRRFLLASSPDEGEPRLSPADSEHAIRVLRLSNGDRLIGLDGHGGAWPLVVAGRSGRKLRLAVDGEPRRAPAPGEPGASLPFLEVAVSLPRGHRAEELVRRLVQLGAARLTALATERGPEHARDGRRLVRLERVAREALKQCGRLHALELRGPLPAEEVLRGASAAVRLSPAAERPLAAVLEGAGGLGASRAAPLVLAIGPEGGWSPREVEWLEASGTRAASLGPHVLRIETAAEAATAIAVHALWTGADEGVQGKARPR